MKHCPRAWNQYSGGLYMYSINCFLTSSFGYLHWTIGKTDAFATHFYVLRYLNDLYATPAFDQLNDEEYIYSGNEVSSLPCKVNSCLIDRWQFVFSKWLHFLLFTAVVLREFDDRYTNNGLFSMIHQIYNSMYNFRCIGAEAIFSYISCHYIKISSQTIFGCCASVLFICLVDATSTICKEIVVS